MNKEERRQRRRKPARSGRGRPRPQHSARSETTPTQRQGAPGAVKLLMELQEQYFYIL